MVVFWVWKWPWKPEWQWVCGDTACIGDWWEYCPHGCDGKRRAAHAHQRHCAGTRHFFWECFQHHSPFHNVIILHDNARPHVANKTVNKLRKIHWEFLEHPPYNPDLAPSDFHLFSPLKMFLAGQRFTCADKVKAAVRQWFHSQTVDFYRSGIVKLVLRWDKCLNRHGDYVEK